jgi:enoyl-CoA hydratase/carnithine racemase
MIGVHREDRICVLTFERAEKLNAISKAMEQQLLEALDSEDVRSAACVILTGSGRAFSVGGDLNDFTDHSPAAITAYYRETGRVYERFASLPQPTICAIGGYCLGGGFELALQADFRIAEQAAVFGLPELELGIVPGLGAYRLTKLLGPTKAKEILYFHPRLTADEALRFGLVSEVVPDGTALDRALELGARIAELPPLAVPLAKSLVDAAADAPRDAGVLLERVVYGFLAQTQDAEEATNAFLEKRPPTFEGR